MQNNVVNIFANKIIFFCGYTLELPRRSGFNEFPQFILRIKNKEIVINM